MRLYIRYKALSFPKVQGQKMRIIYLIFIAFIVTTLNASYLLAAPPTQLKFCYEDENAFPWVFTHNGQSEGLDIRLMRLVEVELNTAIQLISLPWKRCLKSMKIGQVDGAFASSFKQERLSMGVYPRNKQKKLDTARQIHMSSYSLYTTPESGLQWDGVRFNNLKGKLSAQLGFSIVDKLTVLGARVREVKGPERALTDVLSKISVGAALQTDRADFVLSNSETLKDHLIKLPIALSEKPYYLMLSFNLTKNNPDFAIRIWNAVAKVRDSRAMKHSSEEFWGLMTPY